MKSKRVFAFIIAVLAVFFAAVGCADKGESGADTGEVTVASHSVIGSGGYGAVFDAQIDPFNGDYFAARCDMGSLYFSFDTGKNWIRHNIQGTLYCVKYDPATEGVVWAAGSGIYKSTDHGRTVRRVFPKDSEVKYEGHNYENANYWIYTDKASDYAPQYQIWSMAINRKSGGKNVFAAQKVPSSGMGYKKCVRIYQTKDGENFELFTELDYADNYKIDYDEVNDCLIYIANNKITGIGKDGKTAYTVYQPVYIQFSKGNNISFDSCYDAVKNKNTFVFSAPSDGEHIACACYKTNDLRDKNSYVDITEPLLSLTTDDFGIDEVNDYNKGRPSYEYCEWINGKTVPQRFKWTIGDVYVHSDDVVYMYHEANTDTFDAAGKLYINRRTIVYLKYDAKKESGKRYKWVFGFPLKPYNKYIKNTTWQDADSDFNFGMTTSPQNEDALLYCSNVGIYYTPDGEKVTQLNSNYLSSDELTFTGGDGETYKKNVQRVSTTGMDVICTHTLVTDPFDSKHLLMGCTDIGMLQSYDDGASWHHSLNEWKAGELKNIAYEKYTNTCFDLHFDTKKRGVVYGLWSLKKTVPYNVTEEYLTSPSRFGISYDGGLSWTMKEISGTGCTPYKMQVVYDGDRRIVYIATWGGGFLVTSDLGDSFSDMNAGIDKGRINGKDAIWGDDIVVCDMGIFAATGGASSDGTTDAGHMLYKWNDAGKRFEKIGLPKTVSSADGKEYTPAAIRDIEYDAKNKCLYLACIANVVNNDSKLVKTAGGVWRYKDGEFTQLYDDTVSVFGVNTDSTGGLYATEMNGRISRFESGNTTYKTLIDGLFHSIRRVCFGVSDDILYVPTWGGGTEKITLKRA